MIDLTMFVCYTLVCLYKKHVTFCHLCHRVLAVQGRQGQVSVTLWDHKRSINLGSFLSFFSKASYVCGAISRCLLSLSSRMCILNMASAQ